MKRSAVPLACRALARRRNRRLAHVLLFLLVFAARSSAQEPPPPAIPQAPPAPTVQTTPQKRSWIGRALHPFSRGSTRAPSYKDPKIRGLAIDLQVSPQTVKLAEVRQLEIKVTLTNKSKRPAELDFSTDQRIEIYLMNSAEVVLTKWSDNHAISEKPSTVLINPQEHVEYNETIATRDLTPNKVFIAEVFFPRYPELRIRQKFMTAP